MNIKKFLSIIFILIFLIQPFCFADDTLKIEDLDDWLEVSAESSEHKSTTPQTESKHILALDRKSLTVMYEKDAYSEVAMASTTKIMTCLLVLENCDLSSTISISQNAAMVSGSTLGVHTNDKITLHDLLYGLMLRSGNDCAVAIAEHISGSTEEFAKLMNQKANELNLHHTHFVTPHGLDDENHYTTAYELALLTDYALKNEKFVQIVSTKTTSISINGFPRTISNTNELLGNLDGVYGVKTGFTFNAGRCLVSSCKKNGMDIIVVVLGADTKNQRTRDSIKVIQYVLNNFEYIDLSKYISEQFDVYQKNYLNCVYLYKTTSIPNLTLQLPKNVLFPLKIGNLTVLHSKFYTLNTLSPEIESNSKIGYLTIYYENQILCTLDITLSEQLQKNSWYYYFTKILREFSENFQNSVI